MAVVCAKCGAAVADGAQFCAVCGTAVSAGAPVAASGFTPVNVPGQSAAAPPPPQPPPAGTPPLPGYTQVNAGVPPGAYTPPAPVPYPQAAPATGGSSAVKVILIVLAIVVGLGILGAGAVGFMVWRVAHAIHTSAKNGEFSINTPGGTLSAGAASHFTAAELGTDIYPGAEATKGGMRMNLPSGSITSGVFVTSDSKEQVVSFYKQKLGSDASVFDAADSAMITLKKGEHETVMVTVSNRAGENDGKTKISIVHTTNKGSS
jgi:hypothetical protein